MGDEPGSRLANRGGEGGWEGAFLVNLTSSPYTISSYISKGSRVQYTPSSFDIRRRKLEQ